MIYTIKTLKNSSNIPDVGKALSVLLPGIAIPQGIYVCTLAFNEQVVGCTGISPTFLVVGGLTIVWVSVDKIIKMFRKEDDNSASLNT